MTRPDWPEYFMNIAKVVATRSEDPKTKVGAVLTKDNRIISSGYNGTVSGFEDVDWNSDEKHVHVLHAELNAIVCASATKDTTLYVTHSPCAECAKIIAAAGIMEVIYDVQYKTGCGLTLLRKFGVYVSQVDELK